MKTRILSIIAICLLCQPAVADIQQRGHVWFEPAVTWFDVNVQSGSLDTEDPNLVKVEWHGHRVALVQVDYGIWVSGSHAWEGFAVFEDGSILQLWVRRGEWKSCRVLRATMPDGRWLVEWNNEGQLAWQELKKLSKQRP